jgi:hypothetical protein
MLMEKPRSRTYGYILLALALVFLARVATQAVVAVSPISSLPSMDEWTLPSASPFSTSGLIPYQILFSLQILILIFQAKVCSDFLTGGGPFVNLGERSARTLRYIGVFYATSMVIRYSVTMTLHPERRWLGHTVPIVTHCAIAGFLFTVGCSLHKGADHADPG